MPEIAIRVPQRYFTRRPLLVDPFEVRIVHVGRIAEADHGLAGIHLPEQTKPDDEDHPQRPARDNCRKIGTEQGHSAIYRIWPSMLNYSVLIRY